MRDVQWKFDPKLGTFTVKMNLYLHGGRLHVFNLNHVGPPHTMYRFCVSNLDGAIRCLLVHCHACWNPKGTSLLNARGGIMNELSLPQSDDELTKRLKELHGKRRTEQARRKLERK